MTTNSIEDYNINWLDNIHTSIIFTDSYGNCLYANKFWRDYTGKALEEAKGAGWKSNIHPDDLSKCQKKIDSVTTDHIEYFIPLRLKNKAGEYHLFENIGKPLFDSKGKYLCHISTFTAVSDNQKEIDTLHNLLKEKNLLIHDIIHRTKNNMAVISGMFDMHIDYIENPSDHLVLQTFQHRVTSMALINEKIYQSATLSEINFNFFVEEITKKVKNTYKSKSDGISIKMEAEDIELKKEKIMPSGLIVNELVTNVFKHAFTPNSIGELVIGFSKKMEKYILTVSDNGVGITDEAVIKSPRTLGYIFINALVSQLNGTMKINNKEGLSIKIIF